MASTPRMTLDTPLAGESEVVGFDDFDIMCAKSVIDEVMERFWTT
jgi:hypothetical protein